MASLAELQSQREQHETNLREVEDILAQVPDMEDALEMKADLVSQLAAVNAEIAKFKAASPAEQSVSGAPAEKWSKENHPAFRKPPVTTAPLVEEHKAPTSFKVNDTVLAKYAADKQFYEAKVISVTGSSAAPIYAVNFKGYTGTETVRAQDLRPLPSATSSAQKRKADGSPVVSTPSTPIVSTPHSANSGVISAAANIDSDLVKAVKKEPSKTLDGSDRPAKVQKKSKNVKALETAKDNWKTFQQKAGTGKAAKVVNKESMFRTGESHTAKVGFTNSGHAMRKDAARTRHNYTLD
ncbi:hypothetical protein MBLNU459_g4599t1 [Dothideomycetes sp. NU459]